MVNNSSSTSSPQPWVADFCAAYGPTILSLAKLFIWGGLIFALIAALAEATASFKASGQSSARAEAAGLPAIVEALKGLLQALAGAKVWLAMTIVGVLLLWMAGHSVPAVCVPTQTAGLQNQSPRQATGNVTGPPANTSSNSLAGSQIPTR